MVSLALANLRLILVTSALPEPPQLFSKKAKRESIRHRNTIASLNDEGIGVLFGKKLIKFTCFHDYSFKVKLFYF
jgi:hypothetical protein